MTTHIEEDDVPPCLIHLAVQAWLHFDPKKYFPSKRKKKAYWSDYRNGNAKNKALQEEIYRLRNPTDGSKPMTQRAVAAHLRISPTTVKTYQYKKPEGME